MDHRERDLMRLDGGLGHEDDDDHVELLDDSSASRLAVVPSQDLGTQLRDLAASNPGRTLLPSPIARAVSFATRSTSLALRMGTFLGGYGFEVAKVTTLSSLELGRGILEGILSRAGRDVIVRSRSELVKADAETILEASLESLHRTMTHIVFWTTTGFQMTGTTLSVISEISVLLLSTLDQFFGSTDSSRAIASIITLIRREFENPATGRQGEKVGVVDLVLGLSGMAYLQTWCRRLIEEENRRLEIEEVIWDVVVLDDGERVDMHQESMNGGRIGVLGQGKSSPNRAALTNDGANGKIVATIESHGVQDSEDDEDDGLPEIRLKRQIMRSLPHDAKVSITTSVATTKMITVDITSTGSQSVPLAPPPGVELIEESRSTRPSQSYHSSQQAGGEGMSPTYRVVYRVNRNKERSTSFKKEGGVGQIGFIEQIDDETEEEEERESLQLPDVQEIAATPPPPVPPKPLLKKTSSSTSPPSLDARRPSSSASGASGGSGSAFPKATRIPSASKMTPENTANQKRPRIPPTTTASSSTTRPSAPSRKQSINRLLSSDRNKDETRPSGSSAKSGGKGGFRQALRKGPVPALSSLLHKDDSGSESSSTQGGKGKQKLDTSMSMLQRGKQATNARPSPTTPSHLHVPSRTAALVSKREAPHAPQRSVVGSITRAQPPPKEVEEPYVRASSRASYISVHEHRRDSIVSTTDTYSIHTAEDFRPVSPSMMKSSGGGGGSGSMVKSRSEKDMSNNAHTGSPLKNHRRVKSQLYSPSIYTLTTNDSQTSLVPYGASYKSLFNDTEALGTLRAGGIVDGMFPRAHLLQNITRYMRFASASYGSNFLKVMGISKEMPILRALDDTHHELRSFAHHTESDASSILLSSFVDPQGGSDGTGSTNTGVPLVHYISLDHESKAVVLACRGTLGFEDVLADMTCDYDDLVWRGKSYKVHKGVHASARRLLYGGDGRVLVTLKQALEEFTDYGLVFTGHSLGGAVTALLGVMLSEPAAGGTSFMTSSEPHTRLLLGDGHQPTASAPSHICLPSGRPIHVFAYGPPSTMSASLCRATRGLITSIVNGNDLVPYLSLGVLHDFQAVALAFKTDNNEAKVEVRQRIWEAFQSGIADKWYNNAPPSSGNSGGNKEDDQWAYAALKVLRASMMSQKLLPPGEVFVVESTAVLRRDAFLLRREGGGAAGEESYGRPARRVVLKYVRDVERRFREVRFGTSMLTDHSPGGYEDALNKLRAGVMDCGGL